MTASSFSHSSRFYRPVQGTDWEKFQLFVNECGGEIPAGVAKVMGSTFQVFLGQEIWAT